MSGWLAVIVTPEGTLSIVTTESVIDSLGYGVGEGEGSGEGEAGAGEKVGEAIGEGIGEEVGDEVGDVAGETEGVAIPMDSEKLLRLSIFSLKVVSQPFLGWASSTFVSFLADWIASEERRIPLRVT